MSSAGNSSSSGETITDVEQEAHSLQNRAKNMRTGDTETWARRSLLTVAKLRDNAFSVREFEQALQELLASELVATALQNGDKRRVSLEFYPGGIGEEVYRELVQRPLSGVSKSGDNPLHPSFVWRVFAQASASSQRHVVNSLERLQSVDYPIEGRALGVIIKLRSNAHALQRKMFGAFVGYRWWKRCKHV